MVAWAEEEYSGNCGVLREVVAGDTSIGIWTMLCASCLL